MTVTNTVLGVGRGVGTLGLVAATCMTIYCWVLYWGVGVSSAATDAILWMVLGVLLAFITAGFEKLDRGV